MLLAELEIPKTHKIKMEQNWFRSPFVNGWSNPIMTDIQVPKVKISKLPVLFNLCEVVVSQVEDLHPPEIVGTLEVEAGQLVVGQVKRL